MYFVVPGGTLPPISIINSLTIFLTIEGLRSLITLLSSLPRIMSAPVLTTLIYSGIASSGSFVIYLYKIQEVYPHRFWFTSKKKSPLDPSPFSTEYGFISSYLYSNRFSPFLIDVLLRIIPKVEPCVAH